MARKKKRRSTSPLVGKLRDQLKRANSRNTAVRKELKGAFGPGTIAMVTGANVVGGGVAGAAKGAMGDTTVLNIILAVVALIIIVIGAMMGGKGGASLALAGSGMGAKLLGDVVEDQVDEMTGDDDDDEGEEEAA